MHRFIPTHVGNTTISQGVQTIPTVHPHTRGEHLNPMMISVYAHGSSPHTWGTRMSQIYGSDIHRFIPTHVGNTPFVLTCLCLISVHPHTRGEHHSACIIRASKGGSSPHTWGTLIILAIHANVSRFIPTHVGNTYPTSASSWVYTVHPHTRGEHVAPCRSWHPWPGSSPHTWGTLVTKFDFVEVVRFIPTHVGNTTR